MHLHVFNKRVWEHFIWLTEHLNSFSHQNTLGRHVCVCVCARACVCVCVFGSINMHEKSTNITRAELKAGRLWVRLREDRSSADSLTGQTTWACSPPPGNTEEGSHVKQLLGNTGLQCSSAPGCHGPAGRGRGGARHRPSIKTFCWFCR